jgi:hypothetical protein
MSDSWLPPSGGSSPPAASFRLKPEATQSDLATLSLQNRMKRIRLIILSLVVIGVSAQSLLTGRAEQASTTAPAGPFDNLHFRPIGPAAMSGRISDLAVYEANPAIFYVGTAHGGVWKTVNNGTTFEAQFQEQGLMSIGDVTISQSNPDLVWVGTGESNNRQSTSWGDGSTSRRTVARPGRTWVCARRSTSTGS